MRLSKNLTLGEVIRSGRAKRLGINNYPTQEHLFNLEVIAKSVFQKVRDNFNVPIFVSSGYRSQELNKAIGGSKNSDHLRGMALDMDADVFDGVTNSEIFHFIKDNLEFTQLIWEFGDDVEPAWVHVSYNPRNLKKQVLRATKSGYELWER